MPSIHTLNLTRKETVNEEGLLYPCLKHLAGDIKWPQMISRQSGTGYTFLAQRLMGLVSIFHSFLLLSQSLFPLTCFFLFLPSLPISFLLPSNSCLKIRLYCWYELEELEMPTYSISIGKMHIFVGRYKLIFKMFLLVFKQNNSRTMFLSFQILPSGELFHLFINKLLTSKPTNNSTENAKSNVGQMLV